MHRRDFLMQGLSITLHAALPAVSTAASTIEVIASTANECSIAARAGASRIELAIDLSRGGITPGVKLTQAALALTQLPIRVMLRENAGFEIQSTDELNLLVTRARALYPLSIDGIVIGFLKDGSLDLPALQAILHAAPRQKFTFHNALERCNDPMAAIDVLKSMPQIDLLLVHGRGNTMQERAESLRAYADAWQTSTRSLLVNGYTIDEAVQLQRTCPFLRQFHFGSQGRTPEAPYPNGSLDAQKIATICHRFRAS